MVTIKFEAEKLNSEFVVLPTIMAVASDKKNNIGLCFGWFKSVLTISISWSRKAVKTQV